MDSRGKIIGATDAQARSAAWKTSDLQIVSGYFDPLLASHAERLEGTKRPGAKLIVLLDNPPEPILPLRARAELVAALRSVDLVVMGNGHGFAPEQRFDDDDVRTAASFVAHVLDRMN